MNESDNRQRGNYTLENACNEPWVKKEKEMIKEAQAIREKYDDNQLAEFIFFMFLGHSYMSFQTFLKDLDKRFRSSAYATALSNQFVDAVKKVKQK